ncbi:MAG: type II toxin-antitoxin system RelE/ParE family toxin [Candidatus Taylorbacteria bacterium]
MNIYITRKAQIELASLSTEIQNRISDKIRFFAQYRDPQVFAKYIPTEKVYRWRVGNYRIFYERHDGDFFIMKISRRDKAYD